NSEGFAPLRTHSAVGDEGSRADRRWPARCARGAHSGRLKGAQNDRRRALNAIEGLRQRAAVAAIQMDVVPRRVGDVEAHAVADDERDGFGFELARVTRVR